MNGNRKRIRQADEGFSLIELLIVVSIVGILANIAFPMLYGSLNNAKASRILADAGAVFKAADKYRLESNNYPASAGWGTLPNELQDSLGGMSFTNGENRYAWVGTPNYHGLYIYTTGDQQVLTLANDQWSGLSVVFGPYLILYEWHY